MDLSDVEKEVSQTMQTDRHRLRRMLRNLQHLLRDGKPADDLHARFTEQLALSLDKSAARRKLIPPIEFPPELPITAKAEEIGRLIAARQVVIVSGETGSGKSTQLPKICLKHGYGVTGLIGHTQPRRIAASSVAARVAAELNSKVGELVGYKVRFNDQTNANTLVKLMTDGILLAETRSDSFLNAYDVIIVDEAHERSLNIDFLLGYLRRLLPKRPELRVVITSATIDAERFSEHFADVDGPAPIVSVSGRGYPIEVRYRPVIEDTSADDQRDVFDGIIDGVRELEIEASGDVLVFLPTEGDIRTAAKKLRGANLLGRDQRPLEILPLYARLSSAEQNKVFEPHHRQRIVLATNVAESSLTVPGIRYVIDTGTARISRYAPRSKVQRLPIEPIARASADQRAGRCGRIGPGVCIRLFDEADYNSRTQFTTPEIRRTNLASVILQTKAYKLGPIEEFPFLDPPHSESIRDGYRTLHELAAIDEHRELTELGLRLSQWPVDPRVGRMLIEGAELNSLAEVLIIAAALEIQDPRERPAERRDAADAQHAKFAHETSDFMSLLKLWDFFHHLKEDISRSKLKKACVQNFVSYVRMLEWQDIHRQLLRLVQDARMKVNARKDDYDAIHRALLAGLLSGVALRDDRHEYTGAGGIKFHLWPGSGVFASEPKWIMAAELVETSRRYGRTVAKINPDWIEPLAQHLTNHSFREPHWQRQSERCMAYEKVSLFGLPIVPRRLSPYAQVDPEECRDFLIQHGLLERQVQTGAKFQRDNEALLDHLSSIGTKARRRDYVLDDQTIVKFYKDRLPSEIVDGASLRNWIRRNTKEANAKLTMTVDDLIDADAAPDAHAFPDSIEIAGMNLPLEYRFEPGAEADGITLTMPAEAVQQTSLERLQWLVPGMLEDQITALIRSLPKRLRRNLSPAPETAKQVAAEIPFGESDLFTTLTKALSRIASLPIQMSDFDLNKIDPHLKMRIRLIDAKGKEVASGRDAEELRRQVGGGDASLAPTTGTSAWHRDGLTTWDFDELPEQVQVKRGGFNVPAFPMLVDRGQTVSLRLATTAAAAERSTRLALVRLYALRERREIKSQVRWLPQIDQVTLLAASRMNADDLHEQLIELIARRAFVDDQPLPRTRDDYELRLFNRIERISIATQDVAKLIPPLFKTLHETSVAVEGLGKSLTGEAKEDIRLQLAQLGNVRFLATTPWPWLQQFPRYFQAIKERIQRLSSSGPRDREFTSELKKLWQQYETLQALHTAQGVSDPELEYFRWMIEEYRVSLFAQKLGTAVKVSPQRLSQQLAKVVK